MNTEKHSTDDAASAQSVLGWAEYCCWVAVILMPLLIWWNGPAVSDDQAVVRTGVMVLAGIGAVGLRVYAFLQSRRK
ncbi:MAG: hypothetical protein U0903_05115 [Planctomycetales bacterium]